MPRYTLPPPLPPTAPGICTNAVQIPDYWKTLTWRVLRKLAEDLKGAPVADTAEAKTVIEAELAHRQAR